MGLGNFRNRILIAVVLIFVLWQSSRIWFPLSIEKTDTYEVNHYGVISEELEEKSDLPKVHVVVYYEALCPDSRGFFVRHLLPTYEKLSKNMNVKTIPYGKAETKKTADGYTFKCQHGPIECEANMIHACAIDVIKDHKQRLKYLTCMIQSNNNPEAIMKSCAEQMDLDYEPILNCFKGENGKKLLAAYGKITERHRDQITFIPAVSLNKSFNYQTAILKNLLKEVCTVLKNVSDVCTP